MSKKSGSKVVDVRLACCYDTLTAPIKEAVLEMKPGEALEVILSPGFKSEFDRFIVEEGHEILEEIKQEQEIHCKMSLKSKERGDEGKKENCMVCGGALEYLTEALI